MIDEQERAPGEAQPHRFPREALRLPGIRASVWQDRYLFSARWASSPKLSGTAMKRSLGCGLRSGNSRNTGPSCPFATGGLAKSRGEFVNGRFRAGWIVFEVTICFQIERYFFLLCILRQGLRGARFSANQEGAFFLQGIEIELNQ